MACQPKKPKTLLNLMNIHKTRTFQIFEFQNSKSFNFRVLKLEICQFRVSKLEIVQFSSFETRNLSIFEFQENETK